MLDDFLYFFTLTISITLGYYYKNIEDVEDKKICGVVIGIFTVFLICGQYMFHTILMVWLNVIILKCCDRSYVHQMSLVYTWLHLLYLHINLINAQYIIWLHQSIALRLVGMAFEMNAAVKQIKKKSTSSLIIISSEDKVHVLEPSMIDIISYAFFFAGLHKGPYYKFRIFYDHFNGPFSTLGDFRAITEQKLKKALLYMVSYSILRSRYTPKIYNDDSFYKYDTDTRYLYNAPLLLMFFLKNLIIMLLCDCVCTEVGLGVYPAKMMANPGHGPSMNNHLMKWSEAKLLLEEYNFATLRSFNIKKLLIGPKMKDTLRSWDMSVRYWFWMYIYKSLSKVNSEIRSTCSFIAWTLWSGPSIQQMIISSTLWVYIQLESEYAVLYDTSGQLAWKIGFSIMRMFCLIYLTPCFIVRDASTLLRYYNSIFWVYHIILLVLIVGAMVSLKFGTRIGVPRMGK